MFSQLDRLTSARIRLVVARQAGQNESPLGACHRDVQQAHPLRFGTSLALLSHAVPAERRSAQQPVLVAIEYLCGTRAAFRTTARSLVELHQIDVLEFQTFCAVNGHHLHGVRRQLGRLPLFRVFFRRDRFAQRAHQLVNILSFTQRL